MWVLTVDWPDLASLCWPDCIQLYNPFVTLHACIFTMYVSGKVLARNLPDWSGYESEVALGYGFRGIRLEAALNAGCALSGF
ncbi:hypothetical protein FJD38_00980 [Pseudomonas saxonica]|uniref:Uncharacterized protein n=1 Tax=Pseudomonas saxonica TaxID=2600598 RepID=A0ABY3GNM9_9PSED|nr:hypothetical protein FJD38_00980 [Pseudomonas saxonica]